jgi:hypothetical protein|tara:strand:+ start:189 stop:356 length:168 start_codon:yes stop_codon:yes gene_type:complete
MSKTGAWVLGMQEDAYDMTKEEFILKHGVSCVDVWEDVHNPPNIPDEPFDINIQK